MRCAGTRSRDAALALGWLASIALIATTMTHGRPVNDDYWAIGSLASEGFWGSVVWYYRDFQGNVTSWFFILLHQLAWIDGVATWASAVSILANLGLLAAGSWGVFTFLGLSIWRGWRRWAALTIITVFAWLSLASMVSPNSMTLVFYVPSAIVHVWPWCIALLALGLAVRAGSHRFGSLIMATLGLFGGNLGLVEGGVIACSTACIGILARRSPSAWPIPKSMSIGWVIGLLSGLLLQIASPGTWSRGATVESGSALSTNVDAVNRILTYGESLTGVELSQFLFSIMDVEIWARALVPIAVMGDTFLRPGLLAALFLAGWLVGRHSQGLPRDEGILRSRLLGLTLAATLGVVAYSFSGALYAYAGRHVAGLALVVTALAVGVGALVSKWWARHSPLRSGLVFASLVIFLALAVQQVNFGWTRATAWDQALSVNRVLITQGRVDNLIDVPLRAGLSQSGLRDHGGSREYVDWVRRQKKSVGEGS